VARRGADESRALPAGTVTFLFTDIEGSTRLARDLENDWLDVILTHNRLLRDVWIKHHGVEVGTAGDSFFVAFAHASDGIAAAIEGQRVLATHDWTPHPTVRVRMGIHTGEALVHNNDYVGLQVHAAARVSAAAHGGQILVTETTRSLAEIPTQERLGFVDLGFHQLKDLPAELRLYQISGEGLDREFAAVRSLDLLRNNIPAPSSAFIGREVDRAELHAAIDEHRIVTLLGPGGAGKTRLATEAALDRLERHVDGVWMVELDGVQDDVDAVVTAVAEVFRVREEPGENLMDGLVRHLRDRDLLVVVDNCEHVIQQASDLTAQILAGAPRVRVLATSREALNIPGERITPVAPLPVDDEGSAAVQLFVERVRLVRPEAVMRDEAISAAVIVCRQLDGLPLAIELAAARARVLTVEQIADRLNDRFRLLTSGARTSTPRQQTLRGAVEWSYELLEPAERAVFRKLSVFTGEFDLESAEYLCGDDTLDPLDVLDLVASLVEKSLVITSEAGRYRMLRTIRAYASSCLADEHEQDVALRRHATWIAEQLRAPVAAVGLDIVSTNHDDVTAALDWMLSNDESLACDSIHDAAIIWLRSVRWSEALRFVDRALRTSAATGKRRNRLLTRAFEASLNFGSFDAARRYVDEALSVAREHGDDDAELAALGNLGVIAYQQGDLVAAESLLQQALPNVDGEEAAKRLSHLAVIAHHRGDAPLARQRAEASLALARANAVDECIPVMLNLLGVLASDGGDSAAASQFYNEALELARAAGDARAVVYLLYCLGSLALDEGRITDATPLLAEAIDVAYTADARLDLAENLEAVARLAHQHEQLVRSAELLGAVATMRADLNFARAPNEATAHNVFIDRLRLDLGDIEFAGSFSAGRTWSVEEAVSAARNLLNE
jgi:predicted ATPase/class 3 adenylate cyclase